MAIGISPTVDFAFKLVFGSPDHTRITIHFLNAILNLPSPISSVTIKNPCLEKADEFDKLSILDILAVDQAGRVINIEMQTTLPAGMKQRLVYHGARIYGNQLNEGESYLALDPAIIICVLTKPLFPEADDLHLDFRLRDASARILTDDLQVHLLQLSKLGSTLQNVSVAPALEQWAFFMANAEQLSLSDVNRVFADKEFAEAAGVLEMISKTEEQRMQYEARLKFQMDEAARLEQAQIDGELKGLQIGIEKGRLQGLMEGREEGREEGIRVGLQKGEIIGRIRTFQELLGAELASFDELSTHEVRQLSQLAEQLQHQLRSRQ